MIFDKKYGRLGTLTKHKWRQLLNSNKGLFIRHKHSGYVHGPTIMDSGNIIGDQLNMEVVAFHTKASKDQEAFFKELLKDNEEAAYEYLLTIIDALKIWKQDILRIKYVLKYLEKEEKVLSEKERVFQAKNRKILKSLPENIKRRFPLLFKVDEVNQVDDQGETIEHMQRIEGKLKEHEKMLKEYLENLEKRMPFLF